MKIINNLPQLLDIQKQLDDILTTHKSSGDHDSRYYTEAEMDGKLSGKSDTTHNHDSRYLQKSAVINSNTVTEAGYALDARQANPNVSGSLGAQINLLNRTFTQRISELNTNLSTHKSGSDHDGRYYTETEIDTKLNYAQDTTLNLPGFTLYGYGFAVLIPWTAKGMKIGVSKVKAFTGAGWTTNLTIGGIYQFMGGWVVNCGTVDSMENGKVYLTQIEISVVKS